MGGNRISQNFWRKNTFDIESNDAEIFSVANHNFCTQHLMVRYLVNSCLLLLALNQHIFGFLWWLGAFPVIYSEKSPKWLKKCVEWLLISSVITPSDVISLCLSRERDEQMLKALAGSTLSRDKMINNFTNPGFRLKENLGHCLSSSRAGMVRCPLKD